MPTPSIPPATHHLSAHGPHDASWYSWGPETSARCVVLLHGFMGSGLDFESWIPHLGDGHFIAPDLPHHGHTRVQGEASVDWTADWLGAWLKGLGIERPHVVGYSMGGRVALSGATRDAWSNIQSLTLLGATPGLRTPQARTARMEQDERLACAIEQQGMDTFLHAWRQKPVIASQRNIPQHVRARMDARRLAQEPASLARSLRQMGTGRMRPVWDELSTVEAPVLLLTGADDGKFEGIAAEMAQTLSDARHVSVDGAGHTCHLERPAHTALPWLDFLKHMVAP